MNEKYNGGTIIERGGGYYFVRGESEAGAFSTVAGLKKHFPITKTQEDVDRSKKIDETPETEIVGEEDSAKASPADQDYSELDAKSEKVNDELEPIARKNREKRATARKTGEVKNSDESPIIESEAEND